MGRKVDVNRAADLTGWAVGTLNNKRSRGGGPPYYALGRRVLYDEDELLEWLATLRRRSTSDRGASGADPQR